MNEWISNLLALPLPLRSPLTTRVHLHAATQYFFKILDKEFNHPLTHTLEIKPSIEKWMYGSLEIWGIFWATIQKQLTDIPVVTGEKKFCRKDATKTLSLLLWPWINTEENFKMSTNVQNGEVLVTPKISLDHFVTNITCNKYYRKSVVILFNVTKRLHMTTRNNALDIQTLQIKCETLNCFLTKNLLNSRSH